MTSPYRCTCGLIDVHAHCLPPAYRRALSDAGFTSLDGGYPIPSWSAEKALEVMNANGIDMMMLSVSSPSVGFLPDQAVRVKLAHRINEDVAQTIKAHPGRFGGFATLPLPHVEASLRAIEHAFDELKLDGVVIETNTDGKYLGNPALSPIFDTLNARHATIFLHPTTPGCFEAVGLGRPAPLFEFPCDTARTVIDLVFSNTLQRCPNLKFILPHAGGVLPSIAHRIAFARADARHEARAEAFGRSAVGIQESLLRSCDVGQSADIRWPAHACADLANSVWDRFSISAREERRSECRAFPSVKRS